MRKRRLAAAVMSAAMAASLLATGCGGDSATTTAAQTEAEATKAADEGGKTEASDEGEGGSPSTGSELSGPAFDSILPTDLGLAKIGNGEKLIIGIQQNTFIEDYEENWFTNYLEEQLGVEIEFHYMPADTNDFR